MPSPACNNTRGVPSTFAMPASSRAVTLSELRDGILKRVDVGETPVLLARISDEVRAFSADCPTVVAPEAVPFSKEFGERFGHYFHTLHQANGVTFRLGEKVRAIDGSDRINAVELESGERIEVDAVLFATGVKPATSFVAGLAMDDEGAIRVDASMRPMCMPSATSPRFHAAFPTVRPSTVRDRDPDRTRARGTTARVGHRAQHLRRTRGVYGRTILLDLSLRRALRLSRPRWQTGE